MKRWLSGGVCGVLAAAAGAFIFPPARDVVTTIDIAVPSARVWNVLTDTAAYPAWNPHMRLIGRLVPGEVIEHDEGEGGDRMVFHPTVVAARPDAELRWFGSVWLPRVFDAEHYFLLSAESGGTHVVQGERIRGVALWLFDVTNLADGFDAMNAALKRRAEEK